MRVGVIGRFHQDDVVVNGADDRPDDLLIGIAADDGNRSKARHRPEGVPGSAAAAACDSFALGHHGDLSVHAHPQGNSDAESSLHASEYFCGQIREFCVGGA